MKKRVDKLRKLCICTVATVMLAGCAGEEKVENVNSDKVVEQETVTATDIPVQEEDVVKEDEITDSLQDEQLHIEEKPDINEENEKDNVQEEVENESEAETETETEVETETVAVGKSPLYKALDKLPTMEEVRAMSAETSGWGQGTQTDDLNRPAGSLQYEKKYGSHAVRFIMEEGGEKNIYLTFDEGYENGYTAAILDTLKAKNVRAVFFITMDYAKKEPELVQRMVDEGHVVGNHSVTHPSAGLPSQSLDVQENEVMELHNYVKENFNYEMYLFRFPAGIFSEQSLGVLDKCGYTGVFWSFAYRDWEPDNQMAHGDALKKTVDCLHPGAVYLLHAVSSTNTAILGDFIDTARAEGYTFK